MFFEFRGLYKSFLLPKMRGVTELLGLQPPFQLVLAAKCPRDCWSCFGILDVFKVWSLVLAQKLTFWAAWGEVVGIWVWKSKWLLCVDPEGDQGCLPKVAAALFLHWVAPHSCYFCPASVAGTGRLSPSKTIWVMWLGSAEDLGEDKVSIFNSFTFILSTSFTQLAVRIRELLGNFFPSSPGNSLLPWCFGGL